MTNSNHSRPLTVVQLLPNMQGGGVERGTVEVADELVRKGHRSIVISGGGRMTPELTAAGTEHIQWAIGKKSPATLRWILPLRKLIQSENVDIIHARSRVPAWLAWLTLKSISKQKRPQFITTAHGLNSVGKFSRIMTQGDAVIAVSKTVREYLVQNYSEEISSRIHTIYRGRDPLEFPYCFKPSSRWLEKWKTEFPSLEQKTVLTLPGRLTRLKGHHDFLRLIDSLIGQHPEIHGLIVGGEDPRRKAYAEELRRQVIQMGLQNRITFTGHRTDMREIYAASNIVFSLSTKPESFGRTALEALSMGVPVIGYDHGGIGEILAQAFPQGAVLLGDESQLNSRVSELLVNDSMRFVQEFDQFQLSTMLDKTLALYQMQTDQKRAA